MVKKALGKGLGALIGTASVVRPVTTEGSDLVREVAHDLVFPNPNQPRKTFKEEDLNDLAESIRVHGLLQPLTVRKVENRFEIIAGERRWRAAKVAGLGKVPVMVRTENDLSAFEIALVENLQRADLNPMEEAEGFGELIERYKLTQEQVAKQVSKSRVYVANALRLKNLAAEAQELLRNGRISVGHAKVILGIEDKEHQTAIARQVVQKSLSVRETEKLVASYNAKSSSSAPTGEKKAPSSSAKTPDWRDLELKLQRQLGTKVRLVGTSEKGRIEVDYFTSAELERLLSQLGISSET